MLMLHMDSDFSNRGATNRDIADLAERVRAVSPKVGMTPLAPDFMPGPRDVICARGKPALMHSGNRRYRVMIDMNLDKYSRATTKVEKSLIVSTVVDAVREASPNGGFVKKLDGQWYEVGDHLAREKVGQSFRDALHEQYRSSTKAKRQRRKEVQSTIGVDVETFMRSNLDVADRMAQVTKAASSDSTDLDVKALFNEANKALLEQLKGHQSDYKADNTIDFEPYRLEDIMPLAPAASGISAEAVPHGSSHVHDQWIGERRSSWYPYGYHPSINRASFPVPTGASLADTFTDPDVAFPSSADHEPPAPSASISTAHDHTLHVDADATSRANIPLESARDGYDDMSDDFKKAAI